MDTFTINIAKDEAYGSEDYIGYRHVGNNYTVIVQCDGNGELGSMSKKHRLNDRIYSEIAITTSKYGLRLLNELEYAFRRPRTMVPSITRTIINKMLEDQYGDSMNVYFCLLVCIIDKLHNKLYTFSIGDCGYMLVDYEHNKYLMNPPQHIYAVRVSNSFIRVIPNSTKFNPIIEESIIELPDKYTLMVYSDGIGWDKFVPQDMIISPLTTGVTTATIKDLDVIDQFKEADAELVGNIDEIFLFNMLSIDRKACEHGYKIIDEIYPLTKPDDVSFCIINKR